MAFGFGFGLTRGGSTGGPFATAALDLNFLTGSLDSRVNFSRSGSSATYVNSSGYITTAATNVPRFDYNPVSLAPRGLLIEQSATNLILYSEQYQTTITQWAKGVSTVSPDATTSPDGTLNADKIIVTSVSSSGNISQAITKAASAIQYTASVYAKQGEWNSVGLYMLGGGSFSNRAAVVVNLATGVVYSTITAGTFTGASSTVTNAGNGWYRVTLTATTGTETSLNLNIYPSNNGTFPVGDNVSGIYVWGAQLETGPFATSYIPTTTAIVTRGSDIASMTSTNFSDWFNETTGTFYGEGAPITSKPTAFSFLLEGYNGAVASTVSIGTGNSTTTFGLDARIGGGNNSKEDIAITYTAGGIIKGSVSYDTAALPTPTAGLVLNGSVITANSISTPATATSLYIGSRGGSSNIWNGWVQRIAFFNTKLTDAQMQTLTG